MSKGVNDELLQDIARALINRREVVFVFGAGASVPSGIEASRNIKQVFFEEMIQRYLNRPGSNIVLRAIRTTAQASGIEANDLIGGNLDHIPFEQLMSFARNYSRAIKKSEHFVDDWLESRIPDIGGSRLRYPPSIAHEFVCHLMSSGLIKYLVSLNFDEVLDNELDDELGKGKCRRIVTLEEFQRLASIASEPKGWEGEGNRFLFKPHGTRTMRRSLRYTLEDVSRFSDDKATVLRKVFHNALSVLVGYSSQDLDFMELVEDPLIDPAGFIIVGRSAAARIENFGRRTVTERNIRAYEGTFNEFFDGLAEALYGPTSAFAEQHKKFFTKATRHFIRARINEVLSPASHANRNAQRKALEKEPLFFEKLDIVTEVLIYCFKVRGLFAREALLSCHRVVAAVDAYVNKAESLRNAGEIDRWVNPIDEVITDLKELKLLIDESHRPDVLDEGWCYMPAIGLNPTFKNMATDIFDKYLYPCYLEPFLPGAEKDRKDKLSGDLSRDFSSLPGDFDYDLLSSDVSLFSVPLGSFTRILERRAFRRITEKILDLYSLEGYSLYILSPSVAEWIDTWGARYISEKESGVTIRSIPIKILVNAEVLKRDQSLHFKHVEPIVKRIKKFFGDRGGTMERASGIRYGLTLAFKEENNRIKGEALLFSRPGKASAFSPIHIVQDRPLSKETTNDIEKLRKYFESFRGELLEVP